MAAALCPARHRAANDAQPLRPRPDRPQRPLLHVSPSPLFLRPRVGSSALEMTPNTAHTNSVGHAGTSAGHRFTNATPGSAPRSHMLRFTAVPGRSRVSISSKRPPGSGSGSPDFTEYAAGPARPPPAKREIRGVAAHLGTQGAQGGVHAQNPQADDQGQVRRDQGAQLLGVPVRRAGNHRAVPGSQLREAALGAFGQLTAQGRHRVAVRTVTGLAQPGVKAGFGLLTQGVLQAFGLGLPLVQRQPARCKNSSSRQWGLSTSSAAPSPSALRHAPESGARHQALFGQLAQHAAQVPGG